MVDVAFAVKPSSTIDASVALSFTQSSYFFRAWLGACGLQPLLPLFRTVMQPTSGALLSVFRCQANDAHAENVIQAIIAIVPNTALAIVVVKDKLLQGGIG